MMTLPLSITVDPWALTLISVSVVFFALIILFLLYSLSGAIFTGKLKRKPKAAKGGRADAETAAAIAMALDDYLSGDDVPVAIALALHMYMGESVHDVEPGFITIRRNPVSDWKNKSLTFRKKNQ